MESNMLQMRFFDHWDLNTTKKEYYFHATTGLEMLWMSLKLFKTNLSDMWYTIQQHMVV